MTTHYASFLKHFPYNENCCSFCGKPHWHGSWRGSEKLILVCRDCAQKVLPTLHADATWSPAWSSKAGEHDLALFQSGYWKAQAINASRKGGANGCA